MNVLLTVTNLKKNTDLQNFFISIYSQKSIKIQKKKCDLFFLTTLRNPTNATYLWCYAKKKLKDDNCELYESQKIMNYKNKH